MNFLKNHWLTLIVVFWTFFSFGLFTWAEYGYFCDQGRDHGNQGCESFWSSAHIHDWLYNAAANWQSELIYGVLLVILLKKSRGGDDT
jgi:hypothetical protein